MSDRPYKEEKPAERKMTKADQVIYAILAVGVVAAVSLMLLAPHWIKP